MTPVYPPSIGVWLTPHGNEAVMHYRGNSSDWNTISSVMGPNDEYAIPTGLTGWAVDIGAHVGAVTIALALDNPGLQVIAIEPVPPNADLLAANVRENGLADRVRVIRGAAGLTEPVSVWWGHVGNESAEHHAFIGNNSIAYDHGGPIDHQTTEYAEPVSLSQIVGWVGRIAWLKIDAEGAEWDVLRDPALRFVDHITGEYHPVRGKCRSDLAPLLDATHDVTYPDPPMGVDPEMGPGPFIAVVRS